MIKYLALIALVLILAAILLFVVGTKADDPTSTYAIQNVQTGKNLRPYSALWFNGNRIVLYDHHEWKCLTWQFIQVEGETYQLKNLITRKTFQPSSKPESGVTLWQQPLKENSLQYWEFIKQPGETNSTIILMPKQESSSQQWKLVQQNPWY